MNRIRFWRNMNLSQGAGEPASTLPRPALPCLLAEHRLVSTNYATGYVLAPTRGGMICIVTSLCVS